MYSFRLLQYHHGSTRGTTKKHTMMELQPTKMAVTTTWKMKWLPTRLVDFVGERVERGPFVLGTTCGQAHCHNDARGNNQPPSQWLAPASTEKSSVISWSGRFVYGCFLHDATAKQIMNAALSHTRVDNVPRLCPCSFSGCVFPIPRKTSHLKTTKGSKYHHGRSKRMDGTFVELVMSPKSFRVSCISCGRRVDGATVNTRLAHGGGGCSSFLDALGIKRDHH